MNEVLERARLQQHKQKHKHRQPEPSRESIGHGGSFSLHEKDQLAKHHGRRYLSQFRQQPKHPGHEKLAAVFENMGLGRLIGVAIATCSLSHWSQFNVCWSFQLYDL